MEGKPAPDETAIALAEASGAASVAPAESTAEKRRAGG